MTERSVSAPSVNGLDFIKAKIGRGEMGNLHPDLLVIARRSKHTWVLWVPSHRVHTARGVTFEGFDKGTGFFVPDVDTRI